MCGWHEFAIFRTIVHISTLLFYGTQVLEQALLQQATHVCPPCYLATDYPAHSSCGVRSVDQFSDPHTQLEAYRQRARRMVGVANSAYQRALGRGLTQAQAWNETTIDWTVAAKVRILNFFVFHQISLVSVCVCVSAGSLLLCGFEIVQ